MLMTAVVPSVVVLAATLAAALHLVHPVMIIMTMTVAATGPLVLTTTTPSGIMIFLLVLQRRFSIAALDSIAVQTIPLLDMAFD